MTVLHMDCVDGMRAFADATFDSIVCDPPYELGFMGKSWDSTGIANNVAMWREAFRVLKPGGHLLAFSGSRTYHRMTCAIEDAGFEIRGDAPGRRETDQSPARFFYCAKASKADRGEGNAHPTVKPTDLMRYLCRLVTPPGGVILDPFAGSGSTGKAAKLEGFHFIGFERDEQFAAIANARIEGAA